MGQRGERSGRGGRQRGEGRGEAGGRGKLPGRKMKTYTTRYTNSHQVR